MISMGATPATMPEAAVYPALQKLVAKLQGRVKELESQNTFLIHDNLTLKDQVEKLTPKHLPRAGGVPDDGKPQDNRIKCASNMRQIGLAMKMYANAETRTNSFPRTKFDHATAEQADILFAL